MFSIYLVMFLIPAVVLCWRVIVTKSRSRLLRIGGAAAAMITIVGAFIVYDDLQSFDFRDWRMIVALFAAVSGSLYLLFWARRHRTNQRYRTISILAAIIGFVPFIAAAATAVFFQD
jgi:hypothetical protein